jgi:predicted metal-binding membrane protein
LNGRLLLPAFIVVTTALSWWWIAVMGVDMYGSMNGASAWMMTPVWDAPHVLLLFAMWTVMMVAMMLPSVSPLLLIYNGVARRTPVPGYSPAYVYLVALGYLAVWSLFSLGATVLQRVLSRAFVLNPMMELASRRTSAGLLVAAGIYQMLPMKAACLLQCRAPVAFLTKHASPGAGGAFQLGVRHGVYCVGCCWALMLLLLAGGVMNLWVIIALAVFVAIEKLAPFGNATRWVAGALLILAGGFIALTS